MTRQRVSAAYIDDLAIRLSDRDRTIVDEFSRIRVATGAQLERLVFHELDSPSRAVVRRRVLGRLATWRVLTPLKRRVGGAHGGSAGLVFALDSAGQQLLRRWHVERADDGQRVRRPWTPGQMFLAHSLDVSELYVRLVEASRRFEFEVADFASEPASWVGNGMGGWLKPDAYLVLSTATFSEAVWLEVDRSTETLPTLRRKLVTYLDFVARGQVGPDSVVPRVVITVPDERRLAGVSAVIAELPSAPAGLFTAVCYERAARYLLTLLGLSEQG